MTGTRVYNFMTKSTKTLIITQQHPQNHRATPEKQYYFLLVNNYCMSQEIIENAKNYL